LLDADVKFDQLIYNVGEYEAAVYPVLLLSGPAYFNITIDISSIGIDASG